MDAYTVRKIIGDSPRFISPFRKPCGYYMWADEDNKIFSDIETQEYWEKLRYMSKNIDTLVQQAFNPAFYEFYGVNRCLIASPAEMCQRLVVDSFVLNISNKTIGCCLSNSQFMFGHYIDCLWSNSWELIYSDIC